MTTSSPDFLEKALSAYRATEPVIRAWVQVDPQPPVSPGPLSGMPFGVKDIIETAGLATEYGSPLYAGRIGSHDAAIVTRLRQLGAVLFGKTQTAAFASFDPPPTRNPRNPAHTPGGSSSGSAAAVAAGVVPFALGTQTMGSIIRPASFCGIVGFKPTFGALPIEGVLPFAPSLDTIGFLADTVETCLRVWTALSVSAQPSTRETRFGIPDDLPSVSEEMRAAFERAVGLLDNPKRFKLPVPYSTMLNAAKIINDFEGARSHEQRWRQHGDRIGIKLSKLIGDGLNIPESQYRDSLRLVETAREAMKPVFAEFPVLLTPAAPGSAPEGLESTGDPVMNAVWTALGTPVLGIPMPHAPGLPLGLQLIGPWDAEAMLLHTGIAAGRMLVNSESCGYSSTPS